MSHLSYSVLMILWLLATAAHADVRLPAILSDHAILQKSPATQVWGTADPNEPITVQFTTAKATTTADAQGHWKTTLNLSAVDATPHDLTIQGKTATITLHDILVGEVWLSSGQSNMQFTLNATTGGWDEIAKSANNNLRWFFAQPQQKFLEPQDDIAGHWIIASPETSGDCSGVAYYFAKEIQSATKSPVGLILTAVGGTTIQSWMSAQSLDTDPELSTMKNHDLALVHSLSPDPAVQVMKKKKKRTGPDPALISTWFYNQLIHPLAPCTIAGVIWYQGEAHFNQGDFYRKAFPLFIRDWRQTFAQEIPFYYCQLPNVDKKTPDPNNEGWVAGLRAAQDSGLTEPKTGEAILIDTGEEDLHPPNKEIVGHRLALLAEAGTYGMPVQAQSPRFDTMKIEGEKLIVHFKGATDGLQTNPENCPAQGFAIAGEDKKYHWATAQIEGEKVTLTSTKVPHPTQVRYAYSNNPTTNLVNKAGFPAAPFER